MQTIDSSQISSSNITGGITSATGITGTVISSNDNNLNNLSAENVTAFIENNPSMLKELMEKDFAKPILQSKMDSHFTKSLDTWKTNNLDSLINEKVNELYPAETESDKQLRALQQQVNDMKAEKQRSDLEVVKRDIISEQQINSKFTEFIFGSSNEEINANAVKLKELITEQINQGVELRFKESSHTPKITTSNSKSNSSQLEEFDKMTIAQRTQLKRENPSLYSELVSKL